MILRADQNRNPKTWIEKFIKKYHLWEFMSKEAKHKYTHVPDRRMMMFEQEQKRRQQQDLDKFPRSKSTRVPAVSSANKSG